MAPSAQDSSTGLRDLESRFIKAVFDNMTERPSTDWAGVATDMGLKDAKCARERFRQMSLRHGWGMSGGGGGGGGGAGDAGGAGPSPAKGGRVAKKPRTPRKKAKKEESDEEEMVKTEGVEADFDGEI